MRVYLAGAIRDGNKEDMWWRQQAADLLSDARVSVCNPMSGQYEREPGQWEFNGQPALPSTMVPRDLYQLRRCDTILVNLLPMASGYRSIGTLLEIGVALERQMLIVLVAPKDVLQHPFFAFAYGRFQDLDTAISWLCQEGRSLR